MIKNRYEDNLRDYNKMIIDLGPCNHISRMELAIEIQRSIQEIEQPKVLEIGIGEGDSTKYILEYNKNIELDALDVSPEMIESAKKYLGEDAKRVNFIQSDVLEYLEKSEGTYDAISFSWVIHNFTKEDQNQVFAHIYKGLKPGGKMILMEKFYTDNDEEAKAMYEHQMQRYRNYLPADIAEEIIEHETLDYSPEYIMREGATIKKLEEIGFKNIRIADRVERDVVLIAEK